MEVGLKDAWGDASKRWFKISALPPGTSWFAFDSNGKSPKTLLLSIWFLDNGVRTWSRSRNGTLVDSTKSNACSEAKVDPCGAPPR